MRICERHAGFTLIGLLFLIAGMGVAMAALGTVWHTFVQRENEAELLFIGDQFGKALASYQRATPGTAKSYPANLEDLLRDPRFPNTVRHLRRLYRDPMTGGTEWGLERDTAKGIVGVYSLSDKVPRKRHGFALGQEAFAQAKTYRDWVFKPAKSDAGGDASATAQTQTGQSGTSNSLSTDTSSGSTNSSNTQSGNPGGSSGTSSGTSSGSTSGTSQVDPCVSAYQGQMSICRSSYQNGDLAEWRACTAAALASRLECGKTGGH